MKSPTMRKKPGISIAPAKLRRRAEARMSDQRKGRRSKAEDQRSEAGSGRVLHELQVHQIELEMQNEELRRVQQELEASSAKYIDLYDLAPVGYLTLSEQDVILEANLTAANLLGVDRGHLIRQPVTRFICREDRDMHYLHRRRLFETRARQMYELRMLKKDGSTFWARIEVIVTPRSETDALVSRATLSDITEKKKLDAQLLRGQRLECVGRLASGIAHDLNNILAPILMIPPLLREALQEPAHLRLLGVIQANARRGANIIQQLLTFARGSGGKRASVQLGSVIREMFIIMQETFPKNITILREIHSEPWTVNADATQLYQVLMNLCVNARDAMPQGGTLTLAMENVDVDEGLARMNPDARPGRHVVLSVTDTGTGIAPEVLDKIFDPFFTTREVGKGTGLGLSAVLGIVKGHDGFIQISSKPGQGTQFKVYLPACEAAATGPVETIPGPLPQGHGEIVLVLDDEENLRLVIRKMLTRHGYTVVEARDGVEGLAVFAQHRQEMPVILTDLLMPYMDGQTFIRAVRQLDPQIRIVAMTGHLSEPGGARLLAEPVQAFLYKPFELATLLQTLQQVLHP
jgi:PAS domain S-box-containing protein